MGERERKLNDWEADYRRKLVSPEEAAGIIESGDNIYLPSAYNGYMPDVIVKRKDELRDVTVEVSSPLFDPGWLSPGMEDAFKVFVRTYLASARTAHDDGLISFLPLTNGSYFKPLRDNRSGTRNIDVFIMEVSPPDDKGFMSFGSSVWQKRDYCTKAKTIIAEIDEHMIRTCGDTAIHVSEVDYVVDVTAVPLSIEEIDLVLDRLSEEKNEKGRFAIKYANPRVVRRAIDRMDDFGEEYIEFMFRLDDPTDEVKLIAEYLKPILRDRDTIQIGVGAISGHMIELGVFDHLRDLSIWSEMSAPGMGHLIRRGIATGRHATFHPGKAVFSSLSGMRGDELEWLHENPMIEMRSADYVVNIGDVSRIENMVAINNITQVDLTGQITCETQFGPRLINGPGGQTEFHIGAFYSHGGRVVSVMHSTWADGAVSTILPHLDHGSLVTIPRTYADIIITEYGVAELLGKTHRERAEALIEIAHPKFRSDLEKAVGNHAIRSS